MLLNSAPTPFPDGDPPDPRTTGRVMAFRVGSEPRARTRAASPIGFAPSRRPSCARPRAIRELVLFEGKDCIRSSYKTLLGTVTGRREDLARPGHREPAARGRGGLGRLQHDRRYAPDPRPPRRVPRGRPSTLRRRPGRERRARADPVAGRRPAARSPTSAVRRTRSAYRPTRARASSRGSTGPGGTSGTATSSRTRTTR